VDYFNDLSFTRDVPEMSFVNFAIVGGAGREGHPILRIMDMAGEIIHYYVEFSILHDYYSNKKGEDFYEIEKNPENVSVMITVTSKTSSIE
jgi:hypothetical protein